MCKVDVLTPVAPGVRCQGSAVNWEGMPTPWHPVGWLEWDRREVREVSLALLGVWVACRVTQCSVLVFMRPVHGSCAGRRNAGLGEEHPGRLARCRMAWRGASGTRQVVSGLACCRMDVRHLPPCSPSQPVSCVAVSCSCPASGRPRCSGVLLHASSSRGAQPAGGHQRHSGWAVHPSLRNACARPCPCPCSGQPNR